MIECHFNNIETHILKYIKSVDKVLVCSAWFSNRSILDCLSLIDSTLIVTYQTKYIKGFPDYNKNELDLIKHSVLNLYMSLPNNVMHNKYIILYKDDVPFSIITGSYNYTIQASTNMENIVYIEDINIAKKYENNFNELLKISKKI
jgi:phosphatidylserine/phosphatidylglycerophosphate/cardiolipin synthase-like enzyme